MKGNEFVSIVVVIGYYYFSLNIFNIYTLLYFVWNQKSFFALILFVIYQQLDHHHMQAKTVLTNLFFYFLDIFYYRLLQFFHFYFHLACLFFLLYFRFKVSIKERKIVSSWGGKLEIQRCIETHQTQTHWWWWR